MQATELASELIELIPYGVRMTEKDIDTPPIEFDAKGLDFSTVKRYLNELYKAGYDEIKILYNDAKTLSKLQSYISRTMIGFEIIDQRKSYL